MGFHVHGWKGQQGPIWYMDIEEWAGMWRRYKNSSPQMGGKNYLLDSLQHMSRSMIWHKNMN